MKSSSRLLTVSALVLMTMLAQAVSGVSSAQTPPAATPAPTTPRIIPGTAPEPGSTNAPHPLTSYTPVTDEMLRNPDPNEWIMMRGNYEGWGYSPLKQVNKRNVKQLQLVWARQMEPGVNQGTPLIHDGVMFLGNPNDVIQAIDAVTGEVRWQYRRRLPSLEAMHNNNWGQRKRSIALFEDKIYTTTRDNFLVALDAKTGKELWATDRGGDLYATNTTGPIIVNGVVIAGATCQEAPFGCPVTGHDARTGKELWRNEFIPKPGQPGDETWGGKPFNERWMTGVWGPITYDPTSNMVYYGTSSVGPASEAQRNQPGATLAGTNTRYAVDPATGKTIWSHQVLPRDNWDQECTFEMMPITTDVKPDANAEGMMAIGTAATPGRRRTLTGVPCKTSIMWSFDAAKGDFLWAKSTVFQNLVESIDPKGAVKVNEAVVMSDLNKTYFQCPTHAGGRDWPFAAYSPQTNVMYVMLQNLCADTSVRTDNLPSLPRNQYNTRETFKTSPGKTNVGRLDAIDVATGKTLWTWETPASNYAPVLATAGGVVFNGGMDRVFRAFDQANGKLLWQARLGSQVSGAPVSFSINGRQYISVVAGGGFNGAAATVNRTIDQTPGANMVYVFALPE